MMLPRLRIAAKNFSSFYYTVDAVSTNYAPLILVVIEIRDYRMWAALV
jgi:hypothetical protein